MWSTVVPLVPLLRMCCNAQSMCWLTAVVAMQVIRFMAKDLLSTNKITLSWPVQKVCVSATQTFTMVQPADPCGCSSCM